MYKAHLFFQSTTILFISYLLMQYLPIIAQLRNIIKSTDWPNYGEIIRTTDGLSINIKYPVHGSTVHCEPGEVRAKIIMDVDTFIDSSQIDPTSLLVEFYLDYEVNVVAVTLDEYYKTGVMMDHVLPGQRKIGISFTSTTTEMILLRSLYIIEVAAEESTIDIEGWRSQSLADDVSFNRKEYFESIYHLAYWSNGDLEAASLSGVGSQPDATINVKRAIAELLTSPLWRAQWHGQRIDRFVDIPCGDVGWMDLPFLTAINVSYLGMDIVSSVIDTNQQKFLSINQCNSTFDNIEDSCSIQFKQLDVVDDELPTLYSNDLLMMRALMIHLPVKDNMKLLKKIARSGVKRVLLTTHAALSDNAADFILATGHNINLMQAPYCLCDPVVMYLDTNFERDFYLGLWDLEANPDCFSSIMDTEPISFDSTQCRSKRS